MTHKLDLSSAPWSWRKICRSMRESGIRELTKSMGEAIRYGVMAAFTKGTGPTGKLMGEVDLYMLMATSMSASGRTISLMGTESTPKMMVQFTEEAGTTIKSTGKAQKHGQMVRDMKAITNMGRRLVSASFHGSKEPCTKDIS